MTFSLPATVHSFSLCSVISIISVYPSIHLYIWTQAKNTEFQIMILFLLVKVKHAASKYIGKSVSSKYHESHLVFLPFE